MRILFLVHRFPPQVGGAELWFGEMASRLARSGHQVQVFTFDVDTFPDTPPHARDPIPQHGLQVHRFLTLRFPLQTILLQILKRFDPDAAKISAALVKRLPLPLRALAGFPSRTLRHLFASPSPVAPRLLLEALLRRTPPFHLVLAGPAPFDSLFLLAEWIAGRDGASRVFVPCLHPHADSGGGEGLPPSRTDLLKGADLLIAQTPTEKAILARKGVPEERISVIHPGVRSEMLETLPPAPPPAEDGPPAVLHVGTLSPEKGTVHLVEAMIRLWKEGLNARLVLAGPSLIRFDWMARRIPRRWKGRIRRIPVFSEREKPALFRSCDLFCLPSKVESFGIVFLEAWAAGLPVIGARTGGIPDVIEDGKDGLLVDYGDTVALAGNIRRLLEEPLLRREMGLCGWRKVKSAYSWETQYEKLSSVLPLPPDAGDPP
ncbi:MAG: glycosyltransferase family 4 protein [Planctomycetota bacterium]|jgi:glycosyltransferase involved in cell wall biosynthesis